MKNFLFKILGVSMALNVGFGAWANEELFSAYEFKGFFNPSEVFAAAKDGSPLKPLAPLQNAVFKYMTNPYFGDGGFMNPPGNCSGTFISDKGHFISALHCIKSCLLKGTESDVITYAGTQLREVEDFARKLSTHETYLVNPDENKLKDLKCEIHIDGQKYEAQMISMGGALQTNPSYLNLIENYLTALRHMDLLQMAIEKSIFAMDFAVLKIESDKPTSCAPVASEDPAVGDPLFYMGFPAATQRAEISNSDGINMQFSLGRKNSSYADSQCLAETVDKIHYFKEENLNELLRKALFDHEFNAYSTLEAMSGASGSSVFNLKGEIVGVLSEANASPTETCQGSTNMVSVPRFKEWIVDQAGLQGQGDDVFHCPQDSNEKVK